MLSALASSSAVNLTILGFILVIERLVDRWGQQVMWQKGVVVLGFMAMLMSFGICACSCSEEM